MKISEKFISIQGEGVDIGRLGAFIRLCGCNLRCKWCDTKYASWQDKDYTEETIEDLVDWVKENEVDYVSITGGEPLIDESVVQLVEALKENDIYIDIQTNGTIFLPDLLGKVDMFSVSPKFGTSGMMPKMDILRSYVLQGNGNLLLKFVIQNDEDLKEVKNILEELSVSKEILGTQIILQPEGLAEQGLAEYVLNLKQLSEKIIADKEYWKNYKLKVLPQLHRICWGFRRGI